MGNSRLFEYHGAELTKTYGEPLARELVALAEEIARGDGYDPEDFCNMWLLEQILDVVTFSWGNLKSYVDALILSREVEVSEAAYARGFAQGYAEAMREEMEV